MTAANGSFDAAPVATRRIHVIVDRRDGAIERLLATMYRKRVSYDMLHVRGEASVWRVEVDADLPTHRVAHVLAAIEREPFVIEVCIDFAGTIEG